MAKVLTGPVVDCISGQLQSAVFQRTKAGQVVKRAARVKKPPTEAQMRVQRAFRFGRRIIDKADFFIKEAWESPKRGRRFRCVKKAPPSAQAAFTGALIKATGPDGRLEDFTLVRGRRSELASPMPQPEVGNDFITVRYDALLPPVNYTLTGYLVFVEQNANPRRFVNPDFLDGGFFFTEQTEITFVNLSGTEYVVGISVRYFSRPERKVFYSTANQVIAELPP